MKLVSRLILCLILASPAVAAATAPVLPGNRFEAQPEPPRASANRTRASRSTYEAKYRRVYALLSSDAALRAKIVAAARQYGIDPMHMVGAIVGEHTYNVDAYDRLQTYYVKAVSYFSSDFSFAHAGESLGDFIQRPQFSGCDEKADSYTLWSCREAVWNAAFRGRTVDGTAFPDNRFGAVFFQPFFAGQTFGIGQMSPLTALQMSDTVAKVSGLPKLDHTRPQDVYRTIIDPDLTLAYVAATLKTSIDAYRDIAGFDISKNPGITATLYNVGDVKQRARALKAENDRRRRAGAAPRLPVENYYGWLVNDRLEELKELF